MVKKYTKRVFLFAVCFHFLFVLVSKGQDVDKQKALWIVQNFGPNAVWSEEESIQEFIIGVIGTSTDVYEELVGYSVEKKIKNKNFSVKRFRKIKDITNTHILYVEPNESSNLKEIFDKIGYNTLLITDQSHKTEYTMLDLFDLQKDRKKFEINKENAAEFGITFDKAILLHGGKETDLKELVTNTEKALKIEKQKLEQQSKELARQNEELAKLRRNNLREREENERQIKLNNQQKSEIDKRQAEIDEQSQYLARVQENISVQAEQLTHNIRTLEGQEDQIRNIQEEVKKRQDKIAEQEAEIEKNKIEIKTKNTTLDEQGFLIRFQRIVLFIFVGLVVLIFVLAFYIYRGYLLKQKINEELRVKNVAINKQKEEITNQAYQTDLLNKELERLSIVAAKTENAVTIMDAEGNFEWVNVGFTRLYGYTLQLLINEVDENILGVSSHSDIQKIYDDCITSRKTQVYESKNSTRTGGSIWIQTSLTPILDPEGNVSKLITIETDITKIKDAENEIRNQHNKILEQTQELEATNKELEKLSLVASETENAISIMDAEGNYQWINDGFSRLYGYSYSQLIEEYSRNIITAGTDEEIAQLIKQSIIDKRSMTFDRLEKTREGDDIWVQTTLTPITDEENNLKSVISITSNISKLKQAEQAIRQQSEELMAQKEELIIIRDRIELQNLNINASISYAKTIQTAILPPDIDLNRNFETFVIYKPKDIVSGDFYWHSLLPSNNGGNDLAF